MGRSEFTPFGASNNSQKPKTPLLLVSGALVLVLVGFSLGRLTTPETESAQSEQEQQEQAESSAPPVEEEVSIEGQLFSSDDLTWREHGGAIVPFSADHGPHEDEGGWVRGFSRTPQGALLAGAQIYLQASVTADLPGGAIQNSFENQLIGEHAAPLIEENLERGFDPDPNRQFTRIEAYNFHNYDENSAAYELVIANLDHETEEPMIRFALVASVAWRDGDWRLFVPEDIIDETRVLDSLDGFEPFPGAIG